MVTSQKEPADYTPARHGRSSTWAYRGALPTFAIAVHTDTAQVFTIGEKQGREIHVVVPYPATDGANIGDTVALTGFVRRFDDSKFERDYQWFRRTDYPDVKGGDW